MISDGFIIPDKFRFCFTLQCLLNAGNCSSSCVKLSTMSREHNALSIINL